MDGEAIAYVRVGRHRVALVDAADLVLVSGVKWRHDHGYARGVISGSRVYMHQLILGTDGSALTVDHINHNMLDNRRSNLRACTQAQNALNRRVSRRSTSGFKGVEVNDRKWRARIGIAGRRIHLGYFEDAADAARAYDSAAKKHFGDFAYLNFPEQR